MILLLHRTDYPGTRDERIVPFLLNMAITGDSRVLSKVGNNTMIYHKDNSENGICWAVRETVEEIAAMCNTPRGEK